mmetsp:Transcript_26674/g.25700  ORF Transcript_26674/g.25700 Transcript_26674/m.25700 type:complete len:221 (+) Transcript_26674:924-1586(+)
MPLIELGYGALLLIDFELFLEELSLVLVLAKELGSGALLVEEVDVIDLPEDVPAVPHQVPLVVRRYLLLPGHIASLICMGCLGVVVVPVVDGVAVDVDDLGGLAEQLEAFAGEVQVQRRRDPLRVRKLEHHPLRLLIPLPLMPHILIWDLELARIGHHILARILEVEVEALEVGVALEERLVVAEVAPEDHVLILVPTRARVLDRVGAKVPNIINHQLVD